MEAGFRSGQEQSWHHHCAVLEVSDNRTRLQCPLFPRLSTDSLLRLPPATPLTRCFKGCSISAMSGAAGPAAFAGLGWDVVR
jgi:hypothetical protein